MLVKRNGRSRKSEGSSRGANPERCCGSAWRPVEPAPAVPVHLFWRSVAGPAVQNFRALALDVAEREGWAASRLVGGVTGHGR